MYAISMWPHSISGEWAQSSEHENAKKMKETLPDSPNPVSYENRVKFA
jgi:hypothetical protein